MRILTLRQPGHGEPGVRRARKQPPLVSCRTGRGRSGPVGAGRAGAGPDSVVENIRVPTLADRALCVICICHSNLISI